MDAYGRAQVGGPQPDPSQEWSGHGAETGLEEAVWQMNIGGEGVFGYPERPDEPNCIYYLRTGFCGYGSKCRFNHPRDRAAVVRAARGSGNEFPERFGQSVCQYYMRTGTCKFGASCKYHHPKQGGSSSSALQLNYYGYPLRPGEQECNYYLKTGQCKFGSTCKFHHPHPSSPQSLLQQSAQVVAGPSPFPSPSGPSSQQYGIVVARPPILPSYVASPYGPFVISPSVYPSWAAYPSQSAPAISPTSQLPGGSPTMYGVAQLPPSYLSVQKETFFPERPGQPDCQYYLKTGDCKYGSSCRYHHPPPLIPSSTEVVLNPMGLPLRPGVATCTFYAQHGQCKFGAACMYDHPTETLAPSDLTRMSSSPSVPSSLSGLFLSSIGTSPPAVGHHRHHNVAAVSSSAADVITTTASSAEIQPST